MSTVCSERRLAYYDTGLEGIVSHLDIRVVFESD